MSSPSPGQRDDDDFSYGRLYGRAPRTGGAGGNTLSAVYTFVLVWCTTALIMWFGSLLLGFERGDVGAAVVSLVCSLAAAIAITAWVRRRRR